MMKRLNKFISPAKLNLYLEVNNKRKDGFHNIESLMTFCEVGDVIRIERSKALELKITGPFGKFLRHDENIILKVVKGLEQLYERKFKVRVTLEKNLPISSGMGGGSSNAATVVRAIHNIFGINESKDLDNFLISIGADVPFCYYGKTAVIRGIGEKIEFVNHELCDYYILLINPIKEVSTKKIFEKLKIVKTKKAKKEIKSAKLNLEFLKEKENQLQAVAIQELFEIKTILEFLKSETDSLYSRMTGSGATCFSIYSTKERLKIAENMFKLKFPSFWIMKTKLVNAINDINLV